MENIATKRPVEDRNIHLWQKFYQMQYDQNAVVTLDLRRYCIGRVR